MQPLVSLTHLCYTRCEQNRARVLTTMDTDPQITQAHAALQEELRRLADLAPPAPSDADTPPRQAAQLARLQAAQTALRLAATLLRADDPVAAESLDDELRQIEHQVTEWKRKGKGWFETRMVTRTKVRLEQDEAGQVTAVPVKIAYGPYRYFRWRDADGKTRTHYLGKQQPEDENAAMSPAISAPPPTDQLWATSDDPDHNTTPVDAPAPPPSAPPRQPALDDDADQVGRLLQDLTHALGQYQHRTQISREKAEIVMDWMGDVLDRHAHAVMRQAICAELHRQHWRGAPPADAIGTARLQAVIAMAARDGVAEELNQAVSDVGWELNDHRTLRGWRHTAFVRMLRDSRTALTRAHAQARAAWRRVVDLGIDPAPQIDAGLAELETIHSRREPTLTWEATPHRSPLAVVPALDDPTGRHLTENGQLTLCWRMVPEGAIRDHALGPHGCTACAQRALAQGHSCPCCGRTLTIPVMPDGLCLDCATTEDGQRWRADEAARQERVAAQRGQRRKKRPASESDAPPTPPRYDPSAEPAIPAAPPPAAIVPDPGARAAALVLTIAATTRHLIADGARTLCGKAIDPATAIRQATFYSYADCGACARIAQAQQRTCPACQQPLIQVDAAGHCQVCATRQARGW